MRTYQSVLWILLLAFGAGAAFAATTYTEGAWSLQTSTGTQPATSLEDCKAQWRALPAPLKQRTDYCRQRLVTKVTTDLPPPAPVDCVVSDWSAWSGGNWSACVDGAQSRMESRSRSVVTAPSNGGSACPPLTETRTASQACTVTPPDHPPPASGFTADAGFALSGTIADGQVITITRSVGAFAPHADNNPGSYTWRGQRYIAALVQDFSSGYATQGLSWGDNTGAKWEVVSTGCPANTPKCARWYYSTSRQGELQFGPKVSPAQLLVSMKLKPGKLDAKILRVWWSGGDAYLSTGGTMGTGLRGGNTNGDDVYGSASSFRTGVWSHVELLTNLKSPVSWQPVLDGKVQWSKPWPQNQPASLSGHTIDFGNLLESGNEAWFADLFVDYTFVRCEIADSPTWTARTKNEVFVPLSWSATGLKLGVRQGELPKLSGAAIFCFDSANKSERIGTIQ